MPPLRILTLPPDSITKTTARLHGICNPYGYRLELKFVVNGPNGWVVPIIGPLFVEGGSVDTELVVTWNNLLPNTTYSCDVFGEYVGLIDNPQYFHSESAVFTTEYDSAVRGLVVPMVVTNSLLPSNLWVLYFGVHNYATDCIDYSLGEFNLPPLPPIDATDFRFVGNCLQLGTHVNIRNYYSEAQADTYRTQFQSGSEFYPLILSWPNLNQAYAGAVSLRFGTDTVNMKTTNTFKIANTEVTSFRIIAERPIVSDRVPVILDDPAQFSVTAYGVHVVGTVLPNGEATYVWFEWGSSNYDHATPPINVGSSVGAVPVQTDLTGLEQDQLYHIRSVAQSERGTTYGIDQVFKTAGVTSVHEGNTMPTTVELGQNYPNPFNPMTSIEYSIPTHSRVSLKVFNLLGQQVATLVNDELKQPGRYIARWNAERFPSGMYFCRLESGVYRRTEKMLLLR